MTVRISARALVGRRLIVFLEQFLLIISPSLREVAPFLRLLTQLAVLENLLEELLNVPLGHLRVRAHIDQNVVARG